MIVSYGESMKKNNDLRHDRVGSTRNSTATKNRKRLTRTLTLALGISLIAIARLGVLSDLTDWIDQQSQPAVSMELAGGPVFYR